MYDVKVVKVNTLIRPDGRKKAFVRLSPDHDAVEVANKVRREATRLEFGARRLPVAGGSCCAAGAFRLAILRLTPCSFRVPLFPPQIGIV